ncbi:hypothetical protein, conserved, partial [Perkinsus marinus ATCC 50983]
VRNGVVTIFQDFYDHPRMPFKMKYDARKTVQWKVPPDTVDYPIVLPIFIEGLREVLPMYETLAFAGALELIRRGGDRRVVPVLPKLIQPLKRALESRDPNTLRKALQTLQVMARSGAMLGEALVPYYRQILPVLNMFRSQKSMSMSRDDMDYRLGRNIGALIDETLGVLENMEERT